MKKSMASQITNRHRDELLIGGFTYIGWVVNDKKVVLVALLANQLFAYWLD
jgi:hypothetical protein